MATITVKNIPDPVYERLKASAQVHKRSINNEIIICLEANLLPRRQNAADILAKGRSLRARAIGAPLSLAELNRARRRGRQ